MTDDVARGSDSIEAAIAVFRDGDPVLVYDADDREGEVNIVYPAEEISHRDVARMRNDAGGLVCVALSASVAEALDLPFIKDAVEHPATADAELAYDDRSASSLTVNHRETFTGITDKDRALTIRELAKIASDPHLTTFTNEFRSPGHVHLLRAAPRLLDDRRGHTEFAVALAQAADSPPIGVVCEMLDGETGTALPPAVAADYAEREDLVYVEISELSSVLQ